MSEEPRYLPSINSIEKAFELARLDTKSWTAQDIIISAALFDAYLTGRLGVSCGINDRAPYVSDVQGDPNAIRCSFKIMENVCLRDNDALSVRLPLLLNNAEEVPDQVFSGHAYRCVHSSSPSDVSKNPASDSSSEAGTETVAHSTHNQKETRV